MKRKPSAAPIQKLERRNQKVPKSKNVWPPTTIGAPSSLHSGGKRLKSRRFSIQKSNEKNCQILIRYIKKELDVFQRHYAFIFHHFSQFESSSDSFFPIWIVISLEKSLPKER